MESLQPELYHSQLPDIVSFLNFGDYPEMYTPGKTLIECRLSYIPKREII